MIAAAPETFGCACPGGCEPYCSFFMTVQNQWVDDAVTHSAPDRRPDEALPRGAAPRPADTIAAALPPLVHEEAQQNAKTSDWLAGRSYPSWDAIRARGAARRRGFEAGPGSAGGVRATREWVCEHCGRTFRAKTVHDRRGHGLPRRFCTRRCAFAGQKAEALAERGVPCDALLEQLRQPTGRCAGRPMEKREPAQAAQLAAEVLALIRLQLPRAHAMVMGHVTWSPSQARAHLALLGKVLPDLAPIPIEQQLR
jgi:hypothetical protein